MLTEHGEELRGRIAHWLEVCRAKGFYRALRWKTEVFFRRKRSQAAVETWKETVLLQDYIVFSNLRFNLHRKRHAFVFIRKETRRKVKLVATLKRFLVKAKETKRKELFRAWTQLCKKTISRRLCKLRRAVAASLRIEKRQCIHFLRLETNRLQFETLQAEFKLLDTVACTMLHLWRHKCETNSAQAHKFRLRSSLCKLEAAAKRSKARRIKSVLVLCNTRDCLCGGTSMPTALQMHLILSQKVLKAWRRETRRSAVFRKRNYALLVNTFAILRSLATRRRVSRAALYLRMAFRRSAFLELVHWTCDKLRAITSDYTAIVEAASEVKQQAQRTANSEALSCWRRAALGSWKSSSVERGIRTRRLQNLLKACILSLAKANRKRLALRALERDIVRKQSACYCRHFWGLWVAAALSKRRKARQLTHKRAALYHVLQRRIGLLQKALAVQTANSPVAKQKLLVTRHTLKSVDAVLRNLLLSKRGLNLVG